MDIISARFLKSSPEVSQCPDRILPEFAFIGRSNVGKSSLINLVTNQKNLAKISSKPGKTRLINHFLINETWYLVDLPGYGYAAGSKGVKGGFEEIIEEYFLKRKSLVNIFLLIDSRHNPLTIDLEFIQWLGELELPFTIVFTKTDKLKKNDLKNSIEHYRKELLKSWDELPPIILSSVKEKTGSKEILNLINKLIKMA